MTSVSTSAKRRAFAPAARKLRADTSPGKKPRLGPRKVTAALRVVVIFEGVITLDKDFGAGYFYKVIVEDAVLVK